MKKMMKKRSLLFIHVLLSRPGEEFEVRRLGQSHPAEFWATFLHRIGGHKVRAYPTRMGHSNTLLQGHRRVGQRLGRLSAATQSVHRHGRGMFFSFYLWKWCCILYLTSLCYIVCFYNWARKTQKRNFYKFSVPKLFLFRFFSSYLVQVFYSIIFPFFPCRPIFQVIVILCGVQAPELFNPQNAWHVLDVIEARLAGPLGMRTLDIEWVQTCVLVFRRVFSNSFFCWFSVIGPTMDITKIAIKATTPSGPMDSIITKARYATSVFFFFLIIPSP